MLRIRTAAAATIGLLLTATTVFAAGFSAEDVPAYAGEHGEVYAHIEANSDTHLQALQHGSL
jgi:hypothetical protein